MSNYKAGYNYMPLTLADFADPNAYVYQSRQITRQQGEYIIMHPQQFEDLQSSMLPRWASTDEAWAMAAEVKAYVHGLGYYPDVEMLSRGIGWMKEKVGTGYYSRLLRCVYYHPQLRVESRTEGSQVWYRLVVLGPMEALAACK